MKVTRDVIADLWPLYDAGEGSADTRELVEAFLAADPALAGQLRAAPVVDSTDVVAPKEVEVMALERTRDLVYGRMPWVRATKIMGILFLFHAFGRIVADTSWDVSPAAFIFYVACSAASWVAYWLLLRHYRRRALNSPGD